MPAGRCPKCGAVFVEAADGGRHVCSRLAETTAERKRRPAESAPAVSVPAVATGEEAPRQRYPAEAVLDDDEDDSRIGTLLGDHYRVLEKLGAGGMGSVYLVLHVHLKKRFAVKILHPESADRPEAVARFQKEAVAASRLDHDNIVSVVNFGTSSDGTVYLVMEYLRGRPLSQVLARGLLPLEDVVRIVVPLCRGLAAAHRAGIVHRDLKPENIFVSRRDTADTVKILDFGVSKIKEGAFQDRKITKSGDVLGSPLYMSPEGSRGDAELDGRADLYAVGVMLYEMCAGQVPFSADNYLRVLHQHVSEAPRPPRSLRPDLPAEVEAIILRALAKSPDDRFQTADELAEALTTAVPGVDLAAPLTVTGAGRPIPMSALTPTPRPPLAATPRPPAVTPFPAALSITPPLPLPAPRLTPGAMRAVRRRLPAPLLWAGAAALVAGAVVVVWQLRRERPTVVASPPASPLPVPAPAPTPTAEPVPPPAAAAPVELSVDSTPRGAKVFLDDDPIGETPVSVRVVAGDQKHVLRVELAGFRTDVRDVILDQGRTVAVALRRAGKPRPLDLKEGR